MRNKNNFINADCYLTLEPEFKRGHRGAEIKGVKISKVTQTRPTRPLGAPTLHLKFRIPKSILQPFEILLELPENELEAIVEMEEINGNENGNTD